MHLLVASADRYVFADEMPQQGTLPEEWRYNRWKQELDSGVSAATGKQLTPKQIAQKQKQVRDYDAGIAAGQTPRQPKAPPAPPAQPANLDDTLVPPPQPANLDGTMAPPSQPANLDSTMPQAQPKPTTLPPPPTADQTLNETPTGTSSLTTQNLTDGASAETGQPQTLPEYLQALKQSVQSFNQMFSAQHQVTQPAMKQVYDALKQLSAAAPNMPLTPEISQGISSLISTLQRATQEENQDTQFIQQIGQQASQLAQSLGLSAQTKGQQATQAPVGQPAAAAPVAPATPPSAIPVGDPVQLLSRNPGARGWGSSIGDFFGNLRNIPRNIGNAYKSQTASSTLVVKSAESFLNND